MILNECSIISGKNDFYEKKQSINAKLAHRTRSCQAKLKKYAKTHGQARLLGKLLPIAPHILKSVIQSQSNQHHFIYIFMSFWGLYLCVYTQNTRTSQGKIFRHSIPNHDGSKPVMMMKNEGLCFCTLKRFDGIFLRIFFFKIMSAA